MPFVISPRGGSCLAAQTFFHWTDGPGRYKCTNEECGHVCGYGDMGGDYFETEDGETWSNWICPKCGDWHNESGWIVLNPRGGRPP